MPIIEPVVQGCQHREDYAIKFDLRNDLYERDGSYGGMLYRTAPAGWVMFTREHHEAGFQRFYATEHSGAHSDPCP